MVIRFELDKIRRSYTNLISVDNHVKGGLLVKNEVTRKFDEAINLMH